ncbi:MULTISPECIES: hypothetical protein [Mammaliicoccus]|uniref:Uncharacterized protein n=1 Tax=Mammaliicoccus sciuri TaxID=1296 RepID=A0ABT7HX52_MAMSC|nr:MULTISPECIES: hypothetical protein [Mammaliicoccus]MCJ0913259.1 hypothetical protein [Mammaliicoccus sciuri]MDL0112332.1 hypothetical protein [Mammaliicoccus sciuri]MDL0116234.1 hypothetical protein [Mammaliicoccus sciuri]MEB8141615.1 hypothetical protein [Mammaliicoccus sciuri]
MATEKQVELVLTLQKEAWERKYKKHQIEKMTYEEVSKAIEYLRSKKKKNRIEAEEQATINKMNKWQMNMWKD